MDIKIKLEPIEDEGNTELITNVEIKTEKELIIESDVQWLPIKLENEESEYYQELIHDYDQDEESLIKNESVHEEYTIEYVDESEDDVYEDDEDDENYDYAESEKYETNGNESDDPDNIAHEYNFDLENDALDLEKQENNEKPSSSKVLYEYSFKKWLSNNHIKRECPACSNLSNGYNQWRKHIETNHLELMKAADVNFDIISDNCGICKICKQEFVAQFSRYIHSIKHTERRKLELNICLICNYTASHTIFIKNHIMQEHPEVLKEFEKSSWSKQNLKCPLCCKAYNKLNNLMYHFMDRHPKEYQEKFLYNCNLCHHDNFSGEELFLQHLIEKHELNSWQVLNYQKIFEDKEYVSCLKCHRLYFKNDIRELLKHFLEHKNDCFWTCKFCDKKIDHNKSKVRHLCSKMIHYYGKKQKQLNDINKSSNNYITTGWKIKSLKEFEEYIAHVCPFCKMEFGKMLKWQHHLRTEHQIDTLKGLEMKVLANLSHKLKCIICHTLVANTPEHLHAHRFQHLPYKPYKCLHCAQTLDNFKTAVNHVLKRCQDQEDRDFFRRLLGRKNDNDNYTRSMINIQCPVCTDQIFSEIKSVYKHYEDEHNMFQEFFIKSLDMSVICIICKKQFVKYEKNDCFNHLHLHFDEKSFKCLLCRKSYLKFKVCYHHLFMTHFAKTVKEKVNENSNKKVSLYSNKEQDKECNVMKIPELGKPTIKTHVLNEFAEFITYACPECNEGLTSQQHWYTHITTQHNFFENSNIYFKDTDGSLKCITCKMTLVTSSTQQQKHKLTHMPYRSFICNLCYARCNTLGVLYGHFRRKHFAPGKFECPICSEILTTAHQRTEHLKQNHPRNEWPESMCLICYQILANKASLNTHMSTHDIDRFRYTCEVCSSKLLGLKDFKLHTARHEMRGETKENKKKDDFASHSGYKSRPSHDDIDGENNDARFDEISVESDKVINKRKSLTKSVGAKKRSK